MQFPSLRQRNSFWPHDARLAGQFSSSSPEISRAIKLIISLSSTLTSSAISKSIANVTPRNANASVASELMLTTFLWLWSFSRLSSRRVVILSTSTLITAIAAVINRIAFPPIRNALAVGAFKHPVLAIRAVKVDRRLLVRCVSRRGAVGFIRLVSAVWFTICRINELN